MANLRHLILPNSLKTALWVYRGDVKQQQNSARLTHFLNVFKRPTSLSALVILILQG